MDKLCEKPIRSVKLKGDNLTVRVNDYNMCASCRVVARYMAEKGIWWVVMECNMCNMCNIADLDF